MSHTRIVNKTLVLFDMLEGTPLEINGVLIDAEVSYTLRKADDGDTEIHAVDIGNIYVVADMLSLELKPSGANYKVIKDKLEAECDKLALKLAKEANEYRWQVTYNDWGSNA